MTGSSSNDSNNEYDELTNPQYSDDQREEADITEINRQSLENTFNNT